MRARTFLISMTTDKSWMETLAGRGRYLASLWRRRAHPRRRLGEISLGRREGQLVGLAVTRSFDIFGSCNNALRVVVATAAVLHDGAKLPPFRFARPPSLHCPADQSIVEYPRHQQPHACRRRSAPGRDLPNVERRVASLPGTWT